VRGATVLLLPDPLPFKPDPQTIRSQRSGEEGGSAFGDLAPGRYRVLILTDAERASQGDVEFLRRRSADGGTVEVTAGQAVAVKASGCRQIDRPGGAPALHSTQSSDSHVARPVRSRSLYAGVAPGVARNCPLSWAGQKYRRIRAGLVSALNFHPSAKLDHAGE
jgi:hypothetical protein